MWNARVPQSLLAAVIALGVVMALGLAAGSAHAATVRPTTTSGTQSWAYGMEWVGNCAGSSTGGVSGNLCPNGLNWTTTNATLNNLNIHIFVGVAVIFSQTNNSPLYAISMEKALYVYASAGFQVTCVANCGTLGGGASVSGNGTFVGWYEGFGHANVTTSATVSVNGTSVPAIGLQDASSHQTANATGTFTLSGGLFTGQGLYASAQLDAVASAQFTPALGLVPQQVWPGLMWSSSSTYTASASGTAGSHYYVPCMFQSASGSACNTTAATNSTNFATAVPSSSSVSLLGEDWGQLQIATPSGGTQMVQVITLSFMGALGTSDGVFLLPTGAGSIVTAVFSPTKMMPAAAGALPGVASVASAASGGLDYSTSAGHVGFLGSDLGSTYTAAYSPGSYGMTGAQPMDPTVAQSNANGFFTPAPSGSSGFAWLLPLVILVVVVLVVVGAVMYVRHGKRRVPVTPAPAAAAPAPYGAWPPTAPSNPQAPPAAYPPQQQARPVYPPNSR